LSSAQEGRARSIGRARAAGAGHGRRALRSARRSGRSGEAAHGRRAAVRRRPAAARCRLPGPRAPVGEGSRGRRPRGEDARPSRVPRDVDRPVAAVHLRQRRGADLSPMARRSAVRRWRVRKDPPYTRATTTADRILEPPHETLLDVIDHLLNKGVTATGEVTLGVAGIDLIYLRLSALLCAADRVLPTRPTPALVAKPKRRRTRR